ncbi:phage portal protein [Roseicyclus sp.]|uniref:phage portal protein n=1 Tax=Roseicyclus sp. TaxID=1914329 RepID=UPI003F6A6632
MSIFGKLLSLFGARNSTTVSSSEIRRGDGVWEALTGNNAGIGERAALGVSAVYASVSLVSGAIAAMPMHVYRRANDGDKERLPGDSLWWTLNEEFSPRWTADSGWTFLVASRMLHGDAYAEIIRSPNGAIRGIVPLHPDRVKPITTPDGWRLVYEVHPDRTIERPNDAARQIRALDQDDVLHIPGLGFNGLHGLSPLRHALRLPARLAINAQEFSSRFLENMARPDFALHTDQALTDEQFDRLREALAEHQGPSKAGRPMILDGGLSIAPLTMPMEDMQLLETRKFQVEEIARIYGVPAFMIGHTEKTTSWGSGVEAMGAGFVRYSLRSHLNAFSNEINRKFFRTASRVAEFDTRELERADTKSLYESLRVALGRAGEQPFLSLPEVREFLNLPRAAHIPANQGEANAPLPAPPDE